MAGVDFSPITNIATNGISAITPQLLGVMVAICVLAVVIVGIGLVLAAIRGDGVNHGGKRWDKAIWQEAMNDLKRQERSGVALDAESRRALRQHQGMKI